MNLRCIFCQTPFTISRTEMANGIFTMNEKHQNHYDAHCPRCRRANSISRDRMELFMPNWKEVLKELAAAALPQETKPAEKTDSTAGKIVKPRKTARTSAAPASASREKLKK